MKRNRSIVTVAFFGFSALSLVSAAPAPADRAGESPPKGLSATDWTSIREAHEDWKHRFEENEDGTVSATNPDQRWRMEFDGLGFTVQPRDGEWQWGLELVTASEKMPIAGVAEGNRLSYDRGNGITEWFVNDGRGLEQGWTLEKPTGPLRLKVRGGLEAAVSPQTVSFGGQLTYGGLKAWDAKGRTLGTWFEADGDGFAVHYDDSDAAYPITIDPIAQQAYLKASNTGLFDNFGNSVSVSGDTVVVGAYLEGSNSTGVNSTPNDDGNANQSGAAYVFVRSGGIWSQQAYLKASNTGANDQFGVSVSVSGDTVVVGADMEDSNTTGVDSDPDDDGTANNSGAAYVFTRSGGIWSLQAYLKASNSAAGDLFGRSVSVMGDTLVVGAIGEDSNATGVDGNQASNTAFTSGAAYVFTRSGGTWSQQAYLKASNTGASDSFGGSVAVSGDTVVVGAHFEDSNTTGVDSVPDDDGTANNSGAAYIFVRSGGNWSQQAYLKASNTGANDLFGRSVAVSGDTVVVGAPNEASNTTGVDSVPDDDGSANDSGAAYVFVRSGGIWSQQAYLKASNTGVGDLFGFSVSVSGDIVLLGAPGESSNSTGVDSVPNDDDLADGSGAAYVFARSGVTWSQQAYLKASNTGASDSFGFSVSVSGDTVVVGVPGEDSNTTGVDSVPDNDGMADNSGAAYLFTISSSPPTLRVIGKKTITTSKSRYSLKGSAADADGDLLRVEARDSRPKGGRKYRSARGTIRWRYPAKLKSGRNVVKIRAVDATGKKSRITRVTIQRR